MRGLVDGLEGLREDLARPRRALAAHELARLAEDDDVRAADALEADHLHLVPAIASVEICVCRRENKGFAKEVFVMIGGARKGTGRRGGSGGGWRGEEAVSARGGRGGRRRISRARRGVRTRGIARRARARASRDRAMPVAARYRPARGLPAGTVPRGKATIRRESGRDATGGCPRARHRAGEERAHRRAGAGRDTSREPPAARSYPSRAARRATPRRPRPPRARRARVSAASGVVPTGAGARGGDPGIPPIAPRSVAIVTRERAPRRLRTVPTRPARRASSGAGFCELGRRPGGTTRCARVRPR